MLSVGVEGSSQWELHVTLMKLKELGRICGSTCCASLPNPWEFDGMVLLSYLVLDEELDTLNGSGSGLRDGGRDTTHCYQILVIC